MKRSKPLKRSSKPIKRSPLKRTRKKAVPKEIKEHWDRVIRLGCVVTFSNEATIHHVHGGSIREALGEQAMPGMAQKQNHWLVIPLHPRLHTGADGIDSGMGVRRWEERYGPQSMFLDRVRTMIKRQYGYCIYEKAGLRL